MRRSFARCFMDLFFQQPRTPRKVPHWPSKTSMQTRLRSVVSSSQIQILSGELERASHLTPTTDRLSTAAENMDIRTIRPQRTITDGFNLMLNTAQQDLA